MPRPRSLLFVVLAACGARTPLDLAAGLDTVGTPGSSQGAHATGDASAATDARTSKDASLASDAPIARDASPPPSPRFGLVQAWGTGHGTAGPAEAWADFYPQEDLPPACALAGATGTCSVVTCPGGLQPVAVPSDNGGTITATVTGTVAPLAYGLLPPPRTYPEENILTSFTTGDTVTFAGPGGPDVPAFELSVTAPPLSDLDPPGFTTVPTTIDTTRDFRVGWTAATSGDAVLSLGDASGRQLVCFFEGTAGSGLVPQADLAGLKTLLAGAAATAEFFVASRASTTVGDWQIEAVAVTWYGAAVALSGPVVLR